MIAPSLLVNHARHEGAQILQRVLRDRQQMQEPLAAAAGDLADVMGGVGPVNEVLKMTSLGAHVHAEELVSLLTGVTGEQFAGVSDDGRVLVLILLESHESARWRVLILTSDVLHGGPRDKLRKTASFRL